MNGLRTAAAISVLALASAVGYGVAPAQSDPTPIAVEVLTPRATFTDLVVLKIRNKPADEDNQYRKVKDPSSTVTAKLTVQPGARFPWHIHPGPVLVTVATGELVYVDGEDCAERSYPTGTSFFDIGNHVHSAYNPGSEVTTLYATWFDAPAEGDLTIPVDAPDCADD